MKKILLSVTMLIILMASSAWAIPIVGDTANSTEALGNFSGSFAYSFTNDTSASITVSLTNTSPVANGGYLVAFAFNNPGNSITGATLSSTSANFGLIGTPDIDDTISGSPFGDFDIGSSTHSSWLGGGSPLLGIAVGNTETFTFTLTGSGFSSLTEQDFIDELGAADYWFAARFQGFDDGGSDKVPAEDSPTNVPEPATMVLLGSGLLGLFGFRKISGK